MNKKDWLVTSIQVQETKLVDKKRYEDWYKENWLPEARQLTQQLAVMSRFLGKQEKLPSQEILSALSEKFVEIRDTMMKVNEQIITLESRSV